jgi:uncharacterized protein
VTWLPTASGRAFDLLHPSPDDIDFEVDIPEALARTPRFGGHVPCGPYSVAQHCVVGADALMRDTQRADIAAAFLLHDAHEAYIGDDIRPKQHALAALAREVLGEVGAQAVTVARQALCDRIDRAVFTAAGLHWPIGADVWKVVKTYDMRMLATERRHLFAPAPRPWNVVECAEPLRVTGRFAVWPWPRAADEYRERLGRYLPAARRCPS